MNKAHNRIAVQLRAFSYLLSWLSTHSACVALLQFLVKPFADVIGYYTADYGN
jgi:hypothetical protein